MTLAPPEKPELIRALEVYDQRSDLQEVYPEFADGDYRRLIAWAAGVSSNETLRRGQFHGLGGPR